MFARTALLVGKIVICAAAAIVWQRWSAEAGRECFRSVGDLARGFASPETATEIAGEASSRLVASA